MKTRPRLCWWCNTRLSSVSHAVLTLPDGNTVLIHKACEKEAKEEFRKLTAYAITEQFSAALARLAKK